MARFAPEAGRDELQSLEGKVVVMTGRSSPSRYDGTRAS